MKFESMVIHCENQYEKEKVVSFLKNNNCKHWDSFLKEGNYIAVYPETPSFTIYKDNITAGDDAFYTYQQFMEKYGMTDLQKKIEEAKNKTHMSLHQMSKAIGFNEHYLSAVVKRNRSEETQKKIIALLDDLIQKSQQELTHDFQGKALHKHIDDAMMIPKSEYSEMYSKNTALCFKVGTLEKEIDHKNQVLDKRNDLYSALELKLKDNDEYVKKMEHNYDALLNGNSKLNEKMLLAEQDSEKWQCDYWTVSRENVELINSKRAISICLALSILIIVAMAVCAVLHFNGVV